MSLPSVDSLYRISSASTIYMHTCLCCAQHVYLTCVHLTERASHVRAPYCAARIRWWRSGMLDREISHRGPAIGMSTSVFSEMEELF
jgi:hypothetical protein